MEKKRFIEKWTTVLIDELTPQFPEPFLEGLETKTVKVGKINLRLGSELFGNYELIDGKGNPILQTSSFYEAKFILYSNRLLTDEVNIPQKEEDVRNILKKYDEKIDSFSLKIKEDFINNFGKTEGLLDITNQIFKRLNLYRY